MPTPRLTAAVHSFAEEAIRLSSSLSAAEAIQWAASPVPKPREDTTERAKGGHGDPTPSIVLDDRRLGVRAAVEAAHRELAAATEKLVEQREAVDAAVDLWNGNDR